MKNKIERFFKWLDQYMVTIVMGAAIIFLFTKVIDANRQRHVYEMKMIEATEKYNEMQREWSQCYVTQANNIQSRTKCENDLWDMRKWLMDCNKKLGY